MILPIILTKERTRRENNNNYLTQIAVVGQHQGIRTTSYFKKINEVMK